MIEKGSPHVKRYPCTRLASQAGPQDLITRNLLTLHRLILWDSRWWYTAEAVCTLPHIACRREEQEWGGAAVSPDAPDRVKRREAMLTKWGVFLLGIGLLSACA